MTVFMCLLVFLLIVGCQKDSFDLADKSGNDQLELRSAEKVDICHYDINMDIYKPISVSVNVLQAHLDHEDKLPGAACDDGDPSTVNDVYLSDCACAGTPVTSYSWEYVRVDDCWNYDVASSEAEIILGQAYPLGDAAEAFANGWIAICRVGETFVNSEVPGAWCTYKNISVEVCTGFVNPGWFYILFRIDPQS
jgi:hypothetical protein